MAATDGLVIKDLLTMGTALVGAVLGVMNTWNAMNQKRVHLRVTPAFTLDQNYNPVAFSIEITNLSAFAVTVAEIGVTLSKKQRAVIKHPQFLDRNEWPRRLEARATVTAHFDPVELAGLGSTIKKAYVRTACSEYRYGTSAALRQLKTILPR